MGKSLARKHLLRSTGFKVEQILQYSSSVCQILIPQSQPTLYRVFLWLRPCPLLRPQTMTKTWVCSLAYVVFFCTLTPFPPSCFVRSVRQHSLGA